MASHGETATTEIPTVANDISVQPTQSHPNDDICRLRFESPGQEHPEASHSPHSVQHLDDVPVHGKAPMIVKEQVKKVSSCEDPNSNSNHVFVLLGLEPNSRIEETFMEAISPKLPATELASTVIVPEHHNEDLSQIFDAGKLFMPYSTDPATSFGRHEDPNRDLSHVFAGLVVAEDPSSQSLTDADEPGEGKSGRVTIFLC